MNGTQSGEKSTMNVNTGMKSILTVLSVKKIIPKPTIRKIGPAKVAKIVEKKAPIFWLVYCTTKQKNAPELSAAFFVYAAMV